MVLVMLLVMHVALGVLAVGMMLAVDFIGFLVMICADALDLAHLRSVLAHHRRTAVLVPLFARPQTLRDKALLAVLLGLLSCARGGLNVR